MTHLLGQLRTVRVVVSFRTKELVEVYLTGATNEMTSFCWVMMKWYGLRLVRIINREGSKCCL